MHLLCNGTFATRPFAGNTLFSLGLKTKSCGLPSSAKRRKLLCRRQGYLFTGPPARCKKSIKSCISCLKPSSNMANRFLKRKSPEEFCWQDQQDRPRMNGRDSTGKQDIEMKKRMIIAISCVYEDEALSILQIQPKNYGAVACFIFGGISDASNRCFVKSYIPCAFIQNSALMPNAPSKSWAIFGDMLRFP